MQLSYRFLNGTHGQKIAALTCFEGGGFGPMTSKSHQVDPHTCPMGGLVVLTSFNQLEFELDTAD